MLQPVYLRTTKPHLITSKLKTEMKCWCAKRTTRIVSGSDDRAHNININNINMKRWLNNWQSQSFECIRKIAPEKCFAINILQPMKMKLCFLLPTHLIWHASNIRTHLLYSTSLVWRCCWTECNDSPNVNWIDLHENKFVEMIWPNAPIQNVT